MEDAMLMRLMTMATWLMLLACFVVGAALAMAAPLTGVASLTADAARQAHPDHDPDVYEFDNLPPPARTGDALPMAGSHI
jgi:hypothetical protein